jgi:hypothetical protein
MLPCVIAQGSCYLVPAYSLWFQPEALVPVDFQKKRIDRAQKVKQKAFFMGNLKRVTIGATAI